MTSTAMGGEIRRANGGSIATHGQNSRADLAATSDGEKMLPPHVSDRVCVRKAERHDAGPFPVTSLHHVFETGGVLQFVQQSK